MSFGSKRHFNWHNFYICFLVSLGQIAFGYPASIIGVTLGQPSFLVYMKLLDLSQDPPVLAEGADQLIGAMSGVFQAGAAINVFIAAFVCDKWGRKAGFYWCALLSVFGGALLVGSVNSTMFIIARLFAGGGSWGFLAVSESNRRKRPRSIFTDFESTILLGRACRARPTGSYGRHERSQHCLGLRTSFLYGACVLLHGLFRYSMARAIGNRPSLARKSAGVT